MREHNIALENRISELEASQHFNGLTPAEHERLAFFVEECGEAIQAAMKVMRHGYESYDPTVPEDKRITNRTALANEMGHVRAAMIMLCDGGETSKNRVRSSAEIKLLRVQQWMHHQGSTASGGDVNGT